MKLGRSACLATLVACSAWFAACSSDTTTPSGDAGPDSSTGGSGGGSGGKGGASGSAGSAGKAGSGGGGAAGAAGSAGSAGKAGAAGSAGSSAGDAGDAGLPTITIDKPKTGDVVGPGTDAPDYPDVPVSFTVTNFTLKAPQSANCMGNCGHVHLIVDNASCNDPATPTLYNNAGFMSPINAGLDYCKGGVAGPHKIILELHYNDHTPVKGADGKVISDSVDVTALEVDGGVPKDAGGLTDH